MKMLHHCVLSTSRDILSPNEPERREIWMVEVPRLALGNDALMHALISFTASHVRYLDRSDADVNLKPELYLSLALQKHNEDITNFTKANSDAAFMTATFIRLIACCQLQERSRAPYVPPTQWLMMVRSALRIYNIVLKATQVDETSIAFRWIQRFPDGLNPESLRLPGNSQQRLSHLLHRTETHILVEPWSVQIEQAYATTLNFLDRILNSMITEQEDKADDTCRRLICFTHFLDVHFVDLVAAQRPRALVILGHYFALLDKFRHVWFIGDTGKRELEGLNDALPEDWRQAFLTSLKEMEDV